MQEYIDRCLLHIDRSKGLPVRKRLRSVVNTENFACNIYYLLFTNWMQGPYREILSSRFLKYGPSLRGPCVKNKGLVFHEQSG